MELKDFLSINISLTQYLQTTLWYFIQEIISFQSFAHSLKPNNQPVPKKCSAVVEVQYTS